MDINDLSFVASPVNTGCDAIIARLEAVTDENGVKVFNSVKYGLDIPELTILGDKCPAVRIWQDSDIGVADTSQFFVREWVSTLSIYLYFYSLPDAYNNFADIQQKRTEIVKFLLRSLEYPDADSAGLTPSNNWWFEAPQEIRIDHTTALRRISSSIDVQPPWYVSRIDLKIRVKNYP